MEFILDSIEKDHNNIHETSPNVDKTIGSNNLDNISQRLQHNYINSVQFSNLHLLNEMFISEMTRFSTFLTNFKSRFGSFRGIAAT